MEQSTATGKLGHIRDAFLFCSYTGVRFSDFKQLNDDCFTDIKEQNLRELKDGRNSTRKGKSSFVFIDRCTQSKHELPRRG